MSNSGKDCLFCDTYKTGEGIAYENKIFYARFDRFPVSPGHTVVIIKRHVESFFTLGEEEMAALSHSLKMVKALIEKTDLRELYEDILKEEVSESSVLFCKKMLRDPGLHKLPDGYNVGINDGLAAGRSIHHLHIHVIPRYLGDVENPRGGVRNIIPGMGNY